MKKISVMFTDVRNRKAMVVLVALTVISLFFIPFFSTGHAASPFQEVYDAGLTKYVGSPLVQATSVTRDTIIPNIYRHHFSTAQSGRGPMCMSGSEFFVETRDGSSDQLIIFLEGGGVCLSEICMATADPVVTLSGITLGNLMGIGGILNRYDHRNPMADFDVVHVPYCDGVIFMGDIDRLLPYKPLSSEPKMAYQRGLQNLTAAFEVAKKKYPHPSRLVLAGTSGGAYGVVAGTALARYYYPDTEILIISDSGAPMLRDQDKEFVTRALKEINALEYVPLASCPDCIDNGHVTKIFSWALERDKNFRLAVMSHSDDFVIGDIFMKSPPPIFREALLRETESLKNASTSRVSRFITQGRGHTYLLDAKAMDFILNIVGGLSTGDYVYPNFTTLKKELQGGLSKTQTDVDGKCVTGYQWLDLLLNEPDRLNDVVDIE